MEEIKSKNGKGLIAVVVVLSILLVGVVGYICYDKFLSESEKEEVVTDSGEGVKNSASQIDDSEPLVQGYEFNLGNVSCSLSDDSKCVKTLTVAYNNENHDLKIETIKNNKDGFVEVSHKIFVDDSEFYTVNGGISDKPLSNVDVNVDGYVYIFDSKNLAFVLPYNTTETSNYNLLMFGEDGKLIDTLNVESSAKGIRTSENSEDKLDSISNLEFDGHSLKMWDLDCEDFTKAHQKNITIENNKINVSIVKTLENVVGSGQGGCRIR